MRAVVHDRYGPPEVLRVEDVERPVPQDDEVLVRVHATTVTRTDCHMRAARPFMWRFMLGLRRPKRRILGVEFTGEVEAVGSAVTRYRVGDRVFGAKGSSHAEYVCVRENGVLARIPDGLSFEDAAVTGGFHQGLGPLRRADVGPDTRLVVYGASVSCALDPLLTGRDHLRLQATLQSVPKAERPHRAEELLHRVGLADAADRKVAGYSGGMKRRLDLALALVHSPRILFLDEPTTGLDPQSRTALWEEVGLLRREAGVTVFLTTQYLEEADVLADRVGIIDQGRIVAEGTPAELKAEIGRPSVHAIPHREEDRPQIAAFLTRFGEPLATTRDVAVRLHEGLGLTDIVRAVDADGIDVVDLELRAPTLDDVFLAKTGRTLEGATEEADAEEQEKRRG